jgi:predicted O-methyltransferase YrrM
MYETDLTNIKDIDFFFYDGPHDEINTRKAVEYFAETLAEEAVIVFDDANWEGVVSGAKAGLAKAKLNVLFEKIWINSVESKDEWWNGFFLVVVKK